VLIVIVIVSPTCNAVVTRARTIATASVVPARMLTSGVVVHVLLRESTMLEIVGMAPADASQQIAPMSVCPAETPAERVTEEVAVEAFSVLVMLEMWVMGQLTDAANLTRRFP
jgi:hypothetical protein